jgi:hypothetical protein
MLEEGLDTVALKLDLPKKLLRHKKLEYFFKQLKPKAHREYWSSKICRDAVVTNLF